MDIGWKTVNFEKTSRRGAEGSGLRGPGLLGAHARLSAHVQTTKLRTDPLPAADKGPAQGQRVAAAPAQSVPGAWPRALLPPLAPRADVTVASRRSCHGGADRPGVGAGVVQGSGPPGEARAERGCPGSGPELRDWRPRPERGGSLGIPRRRGALQAGPRPCPLAVDI